MDEIIETLQNALEKAENDGNFYAEIRRPIVYDTIELLKKKEETIKKLEKMVIQYRRYY